MSEIDSIIKFVNSILVPSDNKFVVDVGAHEMAEFSKYYINKGYKAILIEPQHKCFEILKSNYKYNNNVQLVKKACNDITCVKKLYYGKNNDTQVSTLNEGDSPWFDMVRSSFFEEVECDTLTNILDKQNCPTYFDILKIDAESYDPIVIKGLNLNKYIPNIIITEEYYWEPQNLVNKYTYLEDFGYILLGYIGYNSIWKKRDNNTRYINYILKDFLSCHNLDKKYYIPQLPMKGKW